MSNSNFTFQSRQLADVDVTKLSTEVLQSIYHGCLKELQFRRQETKVQTRESNASEASFFKGLKCPFQLFSNHLAEYASELFRQDWTHLFTGDKDKKYYVYAHAHRNGKPTKIEYGNIRLRFGGPPFYIGKGTGDRAYDMKRNQGHGATLRKLMAHGHQPQDIAHIVCDGMTEPEALALESKLIYLFGTKYEPGRRGLLVNLDIPPRPRLEEGKIKSGQGLSGHA